MSDGGQGKEEALQTFQAVTGLDEGASRQYLASTNSLEEAVNMFMAGGGPPAAGTHAPTMAAPPPAPPSAGSVIPFANMAGEIMRNIERSEQREHREGGVSVRLAVYDLSYGWARWLSPLLFCRRIEVAPHTAILIFGKE